MTTVPNVTLNNGVEMPILGFGVYQIPPDDTEAAVADGARGRLPPPRHRRRLRQRGGGRPGRRQQRHPPRRAVRHDEAVDPGARRGQRHAAPSSSRCERLGLDHVDLYLIHQPLRRLLQLLAGHGAAATPTAWPGRSACRTSTRTGSSTSSRTTRSPRRSTRSRPTRSSSATRTRRSCAPAACRSSPGARSPRAATTCSPTRLLSRDRRRPRQVRRARSCSAG